MGARLKVAVVNEMKDGWLYSGGSGSFMWKRWRDLARESRLEWVASHVERVKGMIYLPKVSSERQQGGCKCCDGRWLCVRI